jgi:hypothetical protein
MVERILLIAALAALSACASQGKRREADLARLLDWFPGRYTNLEQAQEDARAGREPHAALELNIVPIYAPRIGKNVFYLQENVADDPRRVISQRVAAFEVVKDRGIVQTLWTLNEPLRWRDAHHNVDLFKSMIPDDYTAMSGCDLLWKDEEGRFVGANEASTCRVTSPATGGSVRLELRAELSAEALALADQSFDAAGRRVQGNAPDPFYRFIRR